MTATSPSSTFTLGFVTGTAKTLFGPHNTYTGNTGLTNYGGLGEVDITNGTYNPIIVRGAFSYGARGIFTATELSNSGYSEIGFRCVYHPAPACPDANYIPVRYMSPYTQNDFCVAKYEARVVGGMAESKPDGVATVNISRDAAQTACELKGAKYRLINNGEWQTVARTIEAQTTNWTGGAVGSGTLVRGWANDNSGLALDSLAAHKYNSDANTGSTSGALVYRRTHNIVYGDIWDFGGNAFEWALSDNTNGSPFGTSGYINTFTASIPAFSGPIDFVEGTAKLHFGPSGTAYTLLSPDHGGMGYATFGNSSSAIIRGGGYTESPTVHGIFSVDTTNDKSTTRNDLGFRCVYYQ